MKRDQTHIFCKYSCWTGGTVIHCDSIESHSRHIYEITDEKQQEGGSEKRIKNSSTFILVWIIFPMKTVSLEFYTRWKENNQVVKLILNWILEFEFSVFYHNRKILFALFKLRRGETWRYFLIFEHD